MALIISECPTCKGKTLHEYDGCDTDAEGREFLLLRCRTCRRTRRLYVEDARRRPGPGDKGGV